MASRPFPLFGTVRKFNELFSGEITDELPVVQGYLQSFPGHLQAADNYMAVRDFLAAYASNEATFNSYRTHVERMLLWSLLVAEKPLLGLSVTDAECFAEFCLNPLPEWIGNPCKSRFIRIGGKKISKADSYEVNPKWRPFNYTSPKRAWQIANELNLDLGEQPYEMSERSLRQMFKACRLFFKHAIDEGSSHKSNPIPAVQQKYKCQKHDSTALESMTSTQWAYLLEAAKAMADDSPEHETTLFILSTAFFLYIKVSDMIGRGNWQPRMNDFREDRWGSWWYHVPSKVGESRRVSVGDGYIYYLKRYRTHQAMPPLPTTDDNNPLLTTGNEGTDLSAVNIQRALHSVFVSAICRMKSDGSSQGKLENMRSASTHWLRHAFAADDRNP